MYFPDNFLMDAAANRPIGVFDSGIGGLTVLREIIKLLPPEDTLYLGDTARVPYGTKSAETIIRYAVETTDFLMKEGIKLLVVACNTASAVSLPTLKSRYRLPILGVIEPGARRAAELTHSGRVGVIGTERTIKSQAYVQAIQGINPRIRVFSQACPLFVPLAEEGWGEDGVAQMAADRYLQGLIKRNIDVLVLGCTHYPLLKKVIRRTIGPKITLIDSATEIARKALNILKETGLLRKRTKEGNHSFYITDSPERFQAVGKRFLGKQLGQVTVVRV